MREDFYEGSVAPQNLKFQKVLYTIYQLLFILSLIAFGFTFYLWFMLGDTGFLVLFGTFLLMAISFYLVKRKIYLFYDYTYVSGELRIVKVINAKKRKLFLRFDCKCIHQIGKVGSSLFDKLYQEKLHKIKIATPNGLKSNNQLYYIALNDAGEKLLVILECEEKLLSYIVANRGRGIIEKDYK